jgi:hypothetical protein
LKKGKNKKRKELATRVSLKKKLKYEFLSLEDKHLTYFWLSMTWMENPICQYLLLLLCAPRKMNLEGGTAWKTT